MQNTTTSTKSPEARGYLFAIQAYVFWGILPIYWKMVKHVPPFEILAHRIIWSLVFILILLYFRKNLHLRALVKQKKLMVSLLASSILIGFNWGLFVYAVNTDHVLDASMGYYINPLISILLGMVFLKEKMNTLKVIAILFAVSGVLYMTLDYGRFPWLAVILACSFGTYGLLKKVTPVDGLQGLAMETMILSTPALWLITSGLINGTGSIFLVSLKTDILLMLAGVVTVLPLFWFAMGARRIPLSSIGFLQFIAPSMMLVLGVFMFGEVFTKTHAISFVLIWTGLSIYVISIVRSNRKRKIQARLSA